MRVLRNIILVLFVVAIGSCQKGNSLIDTGVSKELAEYRAATISNVNYNLKFTIPATLEESVLGKERLSFDYSGTEPIIIDFKADSVNQIRKVQLNGESAEWKYLNEHIVINTNSTSTNVVVDIEFVAGDRSLNRNPEFLYTLAVPDRARTIYPCFDQPDMKSIYNLSLDFPEEWVAMSGSRKVAETWPVKGFKNYVFEKSLPMSTYHFSFVAGKFEKYSEERGGDTLNIYYRETDSYKVSQLPEIANLTFNSVAWLESYTGLDMPYTKNDMVVIPGFQFGGMEHPGLILYADHVIFKEKNATPNDYFQRASTIAHENTHLWFGDLVTMKWFNDVWTKEVFANYISAKIVEPEFPELNHRLNFMTSYIVPAMAEDRTRGTNAIQQELDNMQNAGLLYGNIIYDKAPVMMRNLENMMGKERFKASLQEYLKSYYHSNATWDDLITIMVKHAPELDIEGFSHVWVKESGMPHLKLSLDSTRLKFEYVDSSGRGLVWPQRFNVYVEGNGLTASEQAVKINTNKGSIPLIYDEGQYFTLLIPNVDGMGYGRMTTPNVECMLNMLYVWNLPDSEIYMQSILMQLYEEYLNGQLDFDLYYNSLLDGINEIQDVQICSTLAQDLLFLMGEVSGDKRANIEKELFKIAKGHQNRTIADMIYRSLAVSCRSGAMVDHFYEVWYNMSGNNLTENNYINIALALAIKMPERADMIIAKQRERITNADVLRRYDFVAPACSADTMVMDSVFNALLEAKNRGVEPWVQSALSYLNSDLREPYSNKYILPALMELQEVQRTGDIFFPKGWCNALLSGHKSFEALEIVESFLRSNPDYPQLLKNKLLQTTYHLERVHR